MQGVECRVRAASQHFDAAVGKILRVAGNAELQRLLAGGGAEEHALHAAANDETCARHHSPPANNFDSGTSRSLRNASLASTMAARAASVKPDSACCIAVSFNGKR